MNIKCDYCDKPAPLVDSACVYGTSYGPIYYCKACDAWVGFHKGTDRQLGRLADRELRGLKNIAHAAFDPLWQEKLRRRRIERGEGYKKAYARGSGYGWLARELGIERKDCHIGMFDIAKCQRVVELCNAVRGAK